MLTSYSRSMVTKEQADASCHLSGVPQLNLMYRPELQSVPDKSVEYEFMIIMYLVPSQHTEDKLQLGRKRH